MKAILASLLLSVLSAGSVAAAESQITEPALAKAAATTVQVHDPRVTRAYIALEAARQDVAYTRAQWDAAIAGDHPVPAGYWARRHFDALQVRRAAFAAWQAAAAAASHSLATSARP